ncbi:MAG: hypothetical protein CMA51_03360 [Euryarchaeota archaeon]|nr:hypothetical protein [Euryarchaeota archaeon]
MSSYAGSSSVAKPRLLVVKGCFSAMGGAERDLIRNIPFLSEKFIVKVATLDPVDELKMVCRKMNFELMIPEKSWNVSEDPVSIILDKDSSLKAWKEIEGLDSIIRKSDFIHIVSGDGSMSIIDLIPSSIPVHLHLLEPHRGLHEDVLHLKVNGQPKRNIGLTKTLLSRARKRDILRIKSFNSRENTCISGNSKYTVSRIKEIYNVDAGLLWPSIDLEDFSKNEEDSEFIDLNRPYVVNIGKASWVKGTWETISVLEETNLSLAHIGGGNKEDIRLLKKHAESCKVEVWFAPRLTQNELAIVLRNARASISLAHGEPFGLTPIEAFAVGTPAIYVNEGGFKDTIVDKENGRLVGRDQIENWHTALKDAENNENRIRWSEAGKERIKSLNLSCEKHAERIYNIYKKLDN